MINSAQDKIIVIYGLSTEGYEIAKRILQNHTKVIIIDENSKLGLSLNNKIVKEFPSIASLMDEELLLNLEPFDKSISNAPIIFFIPRIRKVNYEVKNDIIPKFKEIISNLKSNTSIVFNIPLGIGGNTEIISLIEHLSGYNIGTDIYYYYNPINKNKSDKIILGKYQQKGDPYFDSLINLIYHKNINGIKVVNIASAEILYTIDIVKRYSNLSSINEITKLAKFKEIRIEVFQNDTNSIYLDEIVNGLFDLRILSLSLTNSSALGYIVNGTIRSIEGFIKSLVDELRIQLKQREIKASRTKVTIFWTIDKNEFRGDKILMREFLKSKMTDYIAEVEIQDIENFIPNIITNIIIACSNDDHKKALLKINKNHHNHKIIIISASTFFNTTEI